MRLLVTRPAPSHLHTMRLLESSGHEALYAPVLELRALPYSWPSGTPDVLIVTSAHLFAFLDKAALPADVLALPLVAVGERTARAAAAFGFKRVVLHADDATTLAQMLGRAFAGNTRFLHLSARERSRDFAKLLPHMSVEFCPVYAADPVTGLPDGVIRALEQGNVDGVLHYSRRSASLFIDVLTRAGVPSAAISTLAHFCLAENVAEPLRAAGALRIFTPLLPNEKALMETISAL